jgi:hypothetical protein
MSEIKIKRRSRSVETVLGSNVSSATTFRLDDMAGGTIAVGTMLTAATTLQMFGAVSEEGTYARVYDAGGEPADVKLVANTAAGRMYALPDAVYAVPYLRIVSGSTHSTGVSAIVSLKS